MKNRFIIAGVIVLLISITSLAILFGVSVSRSELGNEQRNSEAILVNGKLFYFSGYVQLSSATGETYLPHTAYELGEISTTYEDVPSKHLQMSIAEGTAVCGTAYGDENNEDVVYLHITVDPTVDGKYYDTKEAEYVRFVSEKLLDNWYIRFDDRLYCKSKNGLDNSNTRTEELPGGYIQGDKIFFTDMYSIPDQNYETNMPINRYGIVYYHPDRTGRIYLFDYKKVTYNKSSNSTKEKSYSIWELKE